MNPALAGSYKSKLQAVRVITEHWGAQNLYCAACASDKILPLQTNTRARDFQCPLCDATYQLKSGHRQNTQRIPDGAYSAMMAAVLSDDVPHLLLLDYSKDWRVENLTLVPSFFFTPSIIECRKPLAATARRVGWTGCTILLSSVPPEGKLRMVERGSALDPAVTRAGYDQMRPIANLGVGLRGWTLDVLAIIHKLGKREFTLTDVYQSESSLALLYPQNNNIRPKIRQRLQALRDIGLVEFLGQGKYRLISPGVPGGYYPH